MAKKAASPSPAAASAPPKPGREAPYLGLARKWRPATFEDMVGQEEVALSLARSITAERIAHAHLLAGPRGVGKTTSARILARAINCDQGPTPRPCGVCGHCVDIAAGRDLDVVEIDAATNTGVDAMRDLLEHVVRAPFGRYKVYVIDEVHMLSTSSFNALLKTLEEPPPRVVFILATTEMEKVPETVRSRCVVHGFRRLSADDVVRRLKYVAEAEGVKLPEAEAKELYGLIARASEGGMRDALVTLDQLISLTEGKPDAAAAERLLGLAGRSTLADCALWLAEGNAKALLGLVDDLVNRGRSLERFVKGLGGFLHDVMLLQADPQTPLAAATGDSLARARELAERFSQAQVFNILNQLFELEERMKRSSQGRFLVEFAFLRMAVVRPVVPVDEVIRQLRAIPDAPAAQPMAAPAAAAPRPSAEPLRSPAPVREFRRSSAPQAAYAFREPDPDDEIEARMAPAAIAPAAALAVAGGPAGGGRSIAGLSSAELIETLSDALPDSHRFLARYLNQALSLRADETGLAVQWAKDDRVASGMLKKDENRAAIERALAAICGRPMSLRTGHSSEAAAPHARPAPRAAAGAMRDPGAEGEDEEDGFNYPPSEIAAWSAPGAAAAPARGAAKPAAEAAEAGPVITESSARALMAENPDFARRARMVKDFLSGGFVDSSGRALAI